MPDSDKPESLLVADIGSVITKVGLVDRVGGTYRFICSGASPTTADPPTADVLVGVRRAIQQIQALTGRICLTDEGQLLTLERQNGQGVDAFAATTSAPHPLRVAIVGLSRAVSVASAALAVHNTYANLEATLALDETGGRWLRSKAGQNGESEPVKKSAQDPAVVAAEALARANPEVIVLVGGIDGGATTALYEIANLVASIAASMEEGTQPVVIFAGNRDARLEIAARIGQVAPLRVVDNVHPALNRENPIALQRELETLYQERKIARLAGIGGLTSWTTEPVQPSAHGFENVIRFLSRRFDMGVLGADVGSTSTVIALARGNSFTRLVRSDLGIGCSLEQVIAQSGMQALLDWLPMETSPEDAMAWYLDAAVHPATFPMTRGDARLQQAAVRQALMIASRDQHLQLDSVDLILLTGGALAHNSDYGALALLALDALQPRGVFTLAVDSLGLASAFGVLAALNPEAAASVIERDAFVTLGTVIAPTSTNREGQTDLHIQVQPSGSGPINVEVEHGSLEVVPLAPGQKATLQVNASAGVDLGPGRRGVFKAEVEGGAVGLIIDARGRPITPPSAGENRHEKIQQWFWDVGS
ncbi:MAG TPA: glutamate mutase L [Anaerolineae bacterium]